MENNFNTQDQLNDEIELLELDEHLAAKTLKPKLSILQRFMSAITNPIALFEDVDRAPKVLMPMLVILILSSLITILNIDVLREAQRTAMIKAYMQQGLTVPSDGFDSLLKSMTLYTVAAAGITSVIALVIKGVVTQLISGFFSSEGSAKKIISSFLYAYIIVTIGTFIGALLSKVTGIGLVTFSPAMILGMDQLGTPLYTVLSAFEIFTLWYLWLSAVAVKIIKGISFPKALLCVLLPYIVAIVASVIMSNGF